MDNFAQNVPGWGGNTPVWQYVCYKDSYEFQGTCKQPNGYIPEAGHEKKCADGDDNDGDGLKDCYDPDCHLSPSCCIDPDKTSQNISSSSWDKSFLVKGYVLGWWGQYTDDWVGQPGEEKFGVRSDYCSDKGDNWAKVDQCNGENCYLREMSCEAIGPNTLTATGAYKCPDGCSNGICKKTGEFLLAKDCSDSDCVDNNKTGPQGAKCCFIDNNCNGGVGAICGNNNECVETACDDLKDNDGDNQTDCEDPSCQDKTCGRDSVCSGGTCKALPGPGKAQLPDVPVVKIFTYKDILDELNKCEVIKQEGVCNTICGTKKCAFADGGRNTCSESGSTKCTCC